MMMKGIQLVFHIDQAGYQATVALSIFASDANFFEKNITKFERSTR